MDRSTLWCQLSATKQVADQTYVLFISNQHCVLFVPSAICQPSPCLYLFLTPFSSFPFLSLVIRCPAPCLHTHKMEGSGEVPIQNSFVVVPAPYPLSSCRGDPGEPYHSSICKCPCTWTTAWACWDWELIYANLRETVTAQHRAGHRHRGHISPAAQLLKKCGKHERCGPSRKRGRRLVYSVW